MTTTSELLENVAQYLEHYDREETADLIRVHARAFERLQTDLDNVRSLAESTAHFLYWSGWIGADADQVKIVLKDGSVLQCGTRTFERLQEALDRACPEWKTWNKHYQENAEVPE